MLVDGLRLRSVAVLVAVALLAGCAAGLQPPRVQVVDLGVQKIHITGLNLDVKFNLRNPNPVPLVIERFEYELRLNDRRVGEGFQPESLTIPAFDEQEVGSRLELGFVSVPQALVAILRQDRVRAHVDAIFHVQHKGSTRKLKASFDQEVPLSR
jgi:LEA14-like dessication related protein